VAFQPVEFVDNDDVTRIATTMAEYIDFIWAGYTRVGSAPELPRLQYATTDQLPDSPDDIGAAPEVHTHSPAEILGLVETIQDAVAQMLVSGANVTLSYDDEAGTISVNADGADAEVMRDVIGAAIVGINGIGVAVNDAGDTITLSISGLGVAQVAGLQGALDEKLDATVATATYGWGYNLLRDMPLGTTTDIQPLIAAAVAAGHRHIKVPYAGAAHPSLSTMTLNGIWLEFEAGARITHNHNDAAYDFTACRVTNAVGTSDRTGPASAADATSATYAFPARSVILRDGNLIDGDFYHEYATKGLDFVGAHNRVTANCDLRNLRHQRGWASAIHAEGAASFDNVVSGHVYVQDCDRALENEDGCQDIRYTGGGHLKNVYPNGYTGQGSAASYENYAAILDAHSHETGGGARRIHFGGRWVLENCGGGGVTFTGYSGANAVRDCTVDEVHFIGRATSTGSEDIRLNGSGHRIKLARFEVGAGISGTNFRIKGLSGGTDNRVDQVVSVTSSARPVVSDDGTGGGLLVNGWSVPIDSTLRSGKYVHLPLRPTSNDNLGGAGTLRVIPFYVHERITIDQLGVVVTTAGDAGSSFRIGIYTNDQGIPGTPLADVVCSGAATGNILTTLGSPLTLEPGWYFGGGTVQGWTTANPATRIIQTASDVFPILSDNPANAYVGYAKVGVTGALPTWGTSVLHTLTAPRLVARLTSTI
jgi:hypothetical protein